MYCPHWPQNSWRSTVLQPIEQFERTRLMLAVKFLWLLAVAGSGSSLSSYLYLAPCGHLRCDCVCPSCVFVLLSGPVCTVSCWCCNLLLWADFWIRRRRLPPKRKHQVHSAQQHELLVRLGHLSIRSTYVDAGRITTNQFSSCTSCVSACVCVWCQVCACAS